MLEIKDSKHGHKFSGIASPSSILFPDFLVAWYKNDEGAGNTVFNNAPSHKWPDLTIENAVDYWGLDSGFAATNEAVPHITKAKWELEGSDKTSGGGSFGGFFKIRSPSLGKNQGIFQAHSEIDLNLGNRLLELYASDFNPPLQYAMIRNMNPNNQSFISMTSYLDKWRFVFLYQKLNGNAEVGLVLDDGTIQISNNDFAFTEGLNIIKSIGIFHFQLLGTNTSRVSAGDIFVWRQFALNLNQFGLIYDFFKLRYGMSLRNGW